MTVDKMYRSNMYGNDNTRFDWKVSQRNFPKVNLYSSSPSKRQTYYSSFPSSTEKTSFNLRRSLSPDRYSSFPSSRYMSSYTGQTNKPSDWRRDGGSLETSFESDYSATSSSYSRPRSSLGITRPLPSYDSFSSGLTSRKPLTDYSKVWNKKDLKTTLMSKEPAVNGCMHCGRTFDLMERLFKHETVCPVRSIKTRLPFDSVSMRFNGKPREYIDSYEYSLKSPVEIPKSNWRAKHEYFISTVRSAKGDDYVPSTSQLNASILFPCSYCYRKFNKGALERHLPICERLTRRRNFL